MKEQLLLTEFNLLVSTSRGNERNACSELWYLLGELGDRRAKIDTTGVIGLVVAQTEIDPIEAVEGLRRKLIESPWKFRHILKVTPIQMVIVSDMSKMAEAASKLSATIKPQESFRITVEKRRTELSSREIIKTMAERIERPVDLNNPDKIILVQVLGKMTGVSVIPPTGILSIEREKRAI